MSWPNRMEKSCNDKLDSLERLFVKNEFYLTPPTRFDDPFDSQYVFRDASTDVAELKRWIQDRVKYEHPRWTMAQVSAETCRVMDESRTAQTCRIRRFKELVLRSIRRTIAPYLGIVSFCRLSDREFRRKLIMWVHYADGCRGFCLKLDKTRLDSNPASFRQVEYKPYPTIKEYRESGKRDSFFLLRKSREWAYENEYRVVMDIRNTKGCGKERRMVEFPGGVLKAVYFGWKMPIRNRKRILNWLRKRADGACVSTFTARPSSFEYSIDLLDDPLIQ